MQTLTTLGGPLIRRTSEVITLVPAIRLAHVAKAIDFAAVLLGRLGGALGSGSTVLDVDNNDGRTI